MSIYQTIAAIGPRFFGRNTLFKYAFNLSPMYRRSTARVTRVSADLLEIRVHLPISYKNKNYVGSIFGGSMFSAVDPFPMVQLMSLLDSKYIVWDRSAEIIFKTPAREDLYAEFTYTREELEQIMRKAETDGELNFTKTTVLTNKDKSTVFCEVRKTIYVATKEHYKNKQRVRKAQG